MSEPTINQRIEHVLNILNGLTLTGFQQFNSVAEAMKQLAMINRELQEQQKEEAPEEAE